MSPPSSAVSTSSTSGTQVPRSQIITVPPEVVVERRGPVLLHDIGESAPRTRSRPLAGCPVAPSRRAGTALVDPQAWRSPPSGRRVASREG